MTVLVVLAVGFAAGAATAYVLTRSGSLTVPSVPVSVSSEGPVNRLELVPPRVSLGDVVAAGIYLTEPDGGDAA